MKKILYIGNQLSQKGKTATAIDTLGDLLIAEGFVVKRASNKKNRVLRLLDMLFSVLKFSNKTDLVLIDTYSTHNFYYAYFVSQLCRVLRLKYIPILHGGDLPQRIKKSPKLSRAIFSHAHIIVAPSLYTKSRFEALGYNNLICIPNAIEIKDYEYRKRIIDTPKLLWVRTFAKIYNPLLAIKILKDLKDKGLNAQLCMVGPEKDETLEDAKALAKSLDLDINFTGKLSKHEWIKLSKYYNIFINTTNVDNMPVSVIEAMALGLPIVSTNVGGLPYLIENDKDGILVNAEAIDEFLKAIDDLMNNPEKVKRISINARAKAESFQWNTIKHLWFEILR
ncbi:glycosyltransferase family 4 protein [Changchengzhania lutea]|uniref:glycosyltransferase family 4 protein n=1 Tax=Changchengzhania lutea TaxID=2049305 RepID=UPI00115D296D|nr:glycosyltransferase family 4 protein [Changchengzhania lutea]